MNVVCPGHVQNNYIHMYRYEGRCNKNQGGGAGGKVHVYKMVRSRQFVHTNCLICTSTITLDLHALLDSMYIQQTSMQATPTISVCVILHVYNGECEACKPIMDHIHIS